MMLDKLLEEMGLTRRDIRIKFKWRGKRYYIPTFNPLWWIICVVEVCFGAFCIWAFCVIMILLAP
jgi:hypothetical protein